MKKMTYQPKEEVEEWIMSLDAPLPGQVRSQPTPAELELDAQAFDDAIAQVGED